MQLSKERMLISFLTLFILINTSFQLLYNYLYVKGMVPSIPVMGYPLIINSLIPVTALLFIKNIKIFSIERNLFYILLFFIIYITFFSLINFTFFSPATDLGALTESFIFLVYYICIVFAFSYYYKIPIRVFKIILIALAFIISIELDFTQTIPFSLDNIAGTTEGHINYQLTSLFLMLTWFCYVFKESNLVYSVFFTLLLLFLLLVSGGRSELVGFFISLVFIILVYISFSSVSFSKKVIIITIGGITLSFFLFHLIDTYFYLFENSRHNQILDLQHNSSWQAREYLLQKNKQHIINNPIMGAYGSHREYGEGSYIHNILSAWQQFGLVGFISYSLVIYIPFIYACYYLLKDKTKYNIYPYLFISIYVVIVSTFTKPIFWFFSGISFGLMFSYLRHRKEILND